MTAARLTPPEPGPTNGLNGAAGTSVGTINDNGPRGLIESVNCVTENTGKEGARLYDKSSTSARAVWIS
jgi:hypothetical protein